MLKDKHILLIVGGGIAAYKSLDLVRLLRGSGAEVRCVMTRGSQRFIAPLSFASLSGEAVRSDLFDSSFEAEMGHIHLARWADLIVIAPLTADLMGRMASGRSDDLASAILLAASSPVLGAPAMNVRMWSHAATRRNAAQIEADGVILAGPDIGDMACGETGAGRMMEPLSLVERIEDHFGSAGVLRGKTALVTSGPTHEAIDPVRYLSNRSSGKQGHAIAAALVRAGARTILVSGPVSEPSPAGAEVRKVETAEDMLAAAGAALPVDVAVCAAAVCDWRGAEELGRKTKKKMGQAPPVLKLRENPDILAALSGAGVKRPRLVVGFAAETEDILENAKAKRKRKGCDWILANDVSAGSGVLGGETNEVHFISEDENEFWSRMSKKSLAERLTARIAERLGVGEG